jgi:hypothetical protein
MSDLALQLKEVNSDDAATLQKLFFPFEEQATQVKDEVYALKVTSADQVADMEKAREYRLMLKSIRVESEKTKKREKEESLRKGKAIDAVYNYILSIIVPMEEHLQWQEDFAKRKEESERQSRFDARRDDLLAYGADPALYNIGDMSDEVFLDLLGSCQKAFQKKKDDERQAEEERIAKAKADAEEHERMRLENERLKAEAEAAQEEQRKIDAQHKAELEAERQKLQAEREAAEADQRKKDAEHKAALESERKERERIEADIQAKKDAELKAQNEAEAAEKKLKLAPDREKLMNLADSFSTVPMPEVTSNEAKAIIKKAIEMLGQASQYVRTSAISL